MAATLPAPMEPQETLSETEARFEKWRRTAGLFLGSFILAKGMSIHGLDKRLAYGIMALKLVGDSTGRILPAFGLICAIRSMWISNTPATAMMCPIALGIVHALAQAAGGNPVPPAIGATLGASRGFMLPVSTPSNAIVFGSGMVPITAMIQAGIFFHLLGGLLLWAGLRRLLPLAGLA